MWEWIAETFSFLSAALFSAIGSGLIAIALTYPKTCAVDASSGLDTNCENVFGYRVWDQGTAAITAAVVALAGGCIAAAITWIAQQEVEKRDAERQRLAQEQKPGR